MPKYVINFVVCLFLVFLVCGCSSNVRVRSYMQDKPRVDQQLNGNSGYLLGSPKEEEIIQTKPTRKIYVLEVSRSASSVAESGDVSSVKHQKVEPVASELFQKEVLIQPRTVVQVELPTGVSDENKGFVRIKGSIVEYTVEKDDTLQKISKKFYDNFSEWPKIYEFNKEIIENPDFVKPGTVLKIPME